MGTKIPSVRLVFDRKKVASKTKKGLVQAAITYERRRKWLSTDVKLYKDQWNERQHVVRRADAAELNGWLDDMVSGLERWLRENVPFSWEKLEAHLNAGRRSDDDLIGFIEDTVGARNDIKESTRKAHGKLAGILREFGGMRCFGDLTKANIALFDNFLHGRRVRKIGTDGTELMEPMRQQSVYGYHRLLRTYIHIAMNKGLAKDDPYRGMRFQRGQSEPDRYLTAAELERLKGARMRSGSVARARDLFVFQCYTGLSYADLAAFDFINATEDGGGYVYGGRRVKTGEPFFFVILEPAMEILRRYGMKLPVTAQQSYNGALKKAAEDAGVGKPLASHWARRTAGMMLLNAGVRLEVVAKILGHSSVKTTEQFYADIQKRTVVEEMKKAGL